MSFGFRNFRLWRGSTLAVSALGIALFLGTLATAQVPSFSEGFDAIGTLPASGWATQNNSVPVGSTGWFQGNSGVFPSQAGAPTAYIGANFNNTTGANTISNWLITPHVNLANGAQLRFWTRTITGNPFPDRLQVRLSTNGASTNVGTGNMGIGDFSNLLLDINPTYGSDYPEVWTQFTVTITQTGTGRFAFRYFVEDGGPSGDNSNFIGIDTVTYNSVVVAANGPCDYTNDGRTDYTVVRNVGGGANGQVRWFYTPAGGTTTVAKDWGLSSDFFLCGNWDTDGADDIAVWRPGAPTVAAFYVLRSADFTALIEPFGQTNDDPTVVADYNGDGRTDFAVYRGGATAGAQSTWYWRSATTPGGAVNYVPFGQNGDFPCPGDYAGNASSDFCVQRNGGGGTADFWILSSAGTTVSKFGTPTDVIVPGDYDGDGKTDIATIRGSGGQIVWYYDPSSIPGVQVIQNPWGASATDFPTAGDYNGDGRTDLGVWRPSATGGQSAFYVYSLSNGAVTIVPFGQNGDYPVANFNTH